MRQIAAVLSFSLLAACATARNEHVPAHPAEVSSDEALRILLEGNARFAHDHSASADLESARRHALANGQKPFAVILTCSDSRVPPEHIFNQGLGELFVVRVAGNVADEVEVGSVEYAAEHLGAHLVMVLGHRKCGAVTAAVQHATTEGHIGAITQRIEPSVEEARKHVGPDKLLDEAIDENARATARALAHDPLLHHLVEAGKLKIVAGVYDLDSGEVQVLPDDATAMAH